MCVHHKSIHPSSHSSMLIIVLLVIIFDSYLCSGLSKTADQARGDFLFSFLIPIFFQIFHVIIHHHKSKTNILIFTPESTLSQYIYNTGYRHTVQTLISKGKLCHQVICLLSWFSPKNQLQVDSTEYSFRALMKDYTSRT